MIDPFTDYRLRVGKGCGRKEGWEQRLPLVMGLKEKSKQMTVLIGALSPPCVKSVSMRVLFKICLVALTAVTLLTSLGLCWEPTVSLLKWSRYSFTTFSEGPPLYSISNATLFDVAIIDPQAETEKQQVKQLLDGGLDSHHIMRYSWAQRSRSRKDHYNDLEERERRRPGRTGRDVWQLQLSSLRYAPFWPKFRELLMTWLANKRYEPKIMQSLVSMIKEPIDRHFHTESTMKYKDCAVVGNSGILLKRNYGEAIDAHQMVMRLNNARTAGFEKFVGEKTTISFVNSNILHQCARRVRCFCQVYGEEVPIVMYVSQVAHLMDVVMCGIAHKAPLLVTDPRFDTLSARIVKWYSVKGFVEQTGKSISEWANAHDGDSFHYSSGMQAVMLALGLCEKVNLFGFGKFNETKHHYHTAQNKELSLHDYEAEYDFYDDLVNKRYCEDKGSGASRGEGCWKMFFNAGLKVRMVTGDKCFHGHCMRVWYSTVGEAAEGPVFRDSNLEQMNKRIAKLQVVTRSLLADKRSLICELQGEVL